MKSERVYSRSLSVAVYPENEHTDHYDDIWGDILRVTKL